MKAFIFTLLIAFQICSCNAQRTKNTLIQKDLVSQKSDSIIQAYIKLGIFSGVVIIAQDGQPFYEKAFGLANRETNTANSLETKFSIGSMNKSFTHTLMLQLIEAGKLSFSSKMVNYLQGFRQENVDKITIENLLNHTSGFGDYYNRAFWDMRNEERDIPGILPLLRKMELDFAPGAEHQYSNAGYIILGAIIEQITGKSYAQNVVEKIAQPLHLNSLVVANVKKTPGRAIGYTRTFEGYTDNEDFINEPRSDGSFYATAADVLSFYRAFFYDSSLICNSVRNKDEFFRQIRPAYSRKGAGIPLAGGFNGANSVHIEMPADNISIVVLANMDEPVAENIGLGILSIINGKQPATALLPAKLQVYQAFKASGIEYVQENFDSLSVNWNDADPKDMLLNNLGYDLLGLGQLDDALAILKLNTLLFPNIANCWDSYGEALLKAGDKKQALAAYKKALEINPEMATAKKAVKALE